MKLRTISAAACVVAVSLFGYSPETQAGGDPHIGDIQIFAGDFCPRGWAEADGRLLPISQNTALFSIIGTIYGGDGRTTMALPDLRGRTAIGDGNGPGLSDVRLGQRRGTETETIATSNFPSHTHWAGIRTSRDAADSSSPQGNAMAKVTDNTYVTGATPNRYMHPDTVEVDPFGTNHELSI